MGELVVIEEYGPKDEWLEEGRRLVHAVERGMFELGDWYAYGVARAYGQGATIAEEIGCDLGTLKIAASVCRSIESLRRRNDLPFAHHREVAPLPPDEQDRWPEVAATERLSQKALRSAIKSSDPSSDQWYTPAWLFDQMDVRFDVDVCAPTEPLHRTCPADHYYTEEDDGLAQEWLGLVWCNPPYSTPEPWVDKMIEHGNGVLLVHMPNNAHWMTRLQHALHGVRLVQSMHFTRPDGTDQRPGYSLMLAAFGQDSLDAVARITGERVGPLWVA